jgi:hypothetical protein
MPAMLSRATPSRPSPVRGSLPVSTRATRLLEGVELAPRGEVGIADGAPASRVPGAAVAGVNAPAFAISPDADVPVAAAPPDPPGANRDPCENVPSWLVPREPVAEPPPPAWTVPAELLAELPPVPPTPAEPAPDVLCPAAPPFTDALPLTGPDWTVPVELSAELPPSTWAVPTELLAELPPLPPIVAVACAVAVDPAGGHVLLARRVFVLVRLLIASKASLRTPKPALERRRSRAVEAASYDVQVPLPIRRGPPTCRTKSGRAVGYGAPVVGSVSRVSPVAISTQPLASSAFVK